LTPESEKDSRDSVSGVVGWKHKKTWFDVRQGQKDVLFSEIPRSTLDLTQTPIGTGPRTRPPIGTGPRTRPPIGTGPRTRPPIGTDPRTRPPIGTGPGAHSGFYSIRTKESFLGEVKRPEREVYCSPHLVPKLRMSGEIL